MPFGLLGKVVGGIIFAIGLLIAMMFPFVIARSLQPEGMSKGGVILGVLLMGIGLYLILG